MSKVWKFTNHGVTFELYEGTYNERIYCVGSAKSVAHAACIGYLSCVLNPNKEQHPKWCPHNRMLETPKFFYELDQIIDALRSNGILSDCPSMRARMNRYGGKHQITPFRIELVYRIETAQHLFFLRCVPYDDEINYFCYGYERSIFNTLRRKARSMPEKCWAVLEGINKIAVIRYGYHGYTICPNLPLNYWNIRETVNQQNHKAGITPQQVSAMLAGCLYGWDSDIADPCAYDKNGDLVLRSHERVAT